MDAADTATLQILSSRFTLDGSAELEERIAEICGKLHAELLKLIPPARLELLLLGGGYGRGEGGVLRTEEGDQPYNDLEFYLFLRGSELVSKKLYGSRVHHMAECLSHEAGIEVEIKISSLRKLERSPVSMFYYDLISGHKCVYGDTELLQNCQHHRAAHRIPLHEATRLLMNRCSGLLFATERLQRNNFGPEEADFVFRNIAKAKLALGDVLLAARGEYHWSCRERHKRLSKIESEAGLPMEAIVEFHGEGVEFKLHPIQSSASRAELAAEHRQVSSVAKAIWLQLESRRLKQNFSDPVAYALSATSKCPETLKFKNVLINARQFGAGTIFEPNSGHYPRERLLNSLPVMLWVDDLSHEPSLLAHVQRQLRTNTANFSELSAAYERIWRNFN